jgi:hypothetical protein
MRYAVHVPPWELLSRPVPLSLGLTSARFLTDILMRLVCPILAPCTSCLNLCWCRVQTHYAVACPSGAVTVPQVLVVSEQRSSVRVRRFEPRPRGMRTAKCLLSCVHTVSQTLSRCACFVATVGGRPCCSVWCAWRSVNVDAVGSRRCSANKPNCVPGALRDGACSFGLNLPLIATLIVFDVTVLRYLLKVLFLLFFFFLRSRGS